MKKSFGLQRNKNFPCYLILLAGATVFVIYHVNKWIFIYNNPRTDRPVASIRTEPNSHRISNYEPFCGSYSLTMNHSSSGSKRFGNLTSNNSTCNLQAVSKSGCESIIETYYQTNPLPNCRSQLVALCKVISSNKQEQFSLKCNFDLCHKSLQISVGLLSAINGTISWHRFSYDTVTSKAILELAILTLANENPFMFIECTLRMSSEVTTQLLVLPYHYKSSQNSQYKPLAHLININIVLVDSVSRQHFYRTLPNTVRHLQKLRSSEDVEVLDFEFFHSIKGRTYEHLKALFEGEIHETGGEVDDHSIPPSAVEFGSLFGKFKRVGYTTLYQEDLCWEYDWGLIKDTGVYYLKLPKDRRFSSFMHAIAKSDIDNLGLTNSICEIFQRFRIIDGFNYLGNLCFAGEYVHDYFLQYGYEALMSHVDDPLLSFMLLNVGHEGTGRRIRTLDNSLARFLSLTSEQRNTIHILFSDHGNSYGAFSQTLEGHLEMYHPFMFMIIPNNIAGLIGEWKIENLKRNQRTLVNILDLHFTLTHLLSIVNGGQTREHIPSNLGLFGAIALRSCDDLQLHHGTLCYCDGWRSSLPTLSVHFLMAEFVLAKVNRKIRKLQEKHRDPSRHCQQLIGIAVSNVWQKITQQKLLVGMDIKVQDDNIFDTIVSFTTDTTRSFQMRIDAIQRISSFGTYRVCAHKNIPLEFCVCSTNQSKKSTIRELRSFPNSSMFSVKTQYRNVHNDCLYIHTRSYKAGVVFEASNTCIDVAYSVKLDFTLENMKLATRMYRKVILPGSTSHLAVLIMVESGYAWRYTYTSDITWKKITSRMNHQS